MAVLDEGCIIQPNKAVHWIALTALSELSHTDVDTWMALRQPRGTFYCRWLQTEARDNRCENSGTEGRL
jgi:hypothetical protein